ncbi:MAG: hypothetical protein VXY77_00105 [Pseudomonadota bacterium]|nr:hypothetical protein [Pseudomonadota bacterium]
MATLAWDSQFDEQTVSLNTELSPLARITHILTVDSTDDDESDNEVDETAVSKIIHAFQSENTMVTLRQGNTKIICHKQVTEHHGSLHVKVHITQPSWNSCLATLSFDS